MHTGPLLVENKKMSKSFKNFITIPDFLKKYSPEVLRMLVLSVHYRSPLNYTDQLALQTQNSLRNIEEFLEKLRLVIASKNKKQKSSDFKIDKLIKVLDISFIKALEDDFNTPKAFSIIFDIISSWQNQIWQFNKEQAEKIIKSIKNKLNVLGIELPALKTPKKIKNLVKKRELLRKNKQFIQADLLRKKIERLGYKIEDTPIGPLILRAS